MKEKIEKESGVKLNDFPESDFEKVEKMMKEIGQVEVWLLRGMGRYYLVSFPPNKENTSFPIKRKLCSLSPLPEKVKVK